MVPRQLGGLGLGKGDYTRIVKDEEPCNALSIGRNNPTPFFFNI